MSFFDRSQTFHTTEIAPSTKVSGDIDSKDHIKVFGQLRGDLKAANVLVSQSGSVHGDVVAPVVVIDGWVKGNVTGSEKVVLLKNAVVDGDIETANLEVVEGGRMNGHCQTSKKAPNIDALLEETQKSAA